MPRMPVFIPGPTMVELTIRTASGRCLFRPVPELVARVLGVIGRALSLYDVEMHAFTFLSNHMHSLISVGDARVASAFQCHVNRNTALVAKDVTGWSGRVWERSSAPIPILDAGAAVARLAYIMANGVKEGLVEHPLHWPGPSSAAALTSSERIEAYWLDRTRRERPVRVAVPIRLTPLPCWSGLEREQRNALVRSMLDTISETARIERLGKPPLGRKQLLEQDPFAPVPLARHRPPKAFASDPALVEAYEANRRSFIDAYRLAAQAYQHGARSERFPAGAILPSRGFEKLDSDRD